MRQHSNRVMTAETITTRLRAHALERPDQAAFTFLVDGEALEERLTYADLHRRAATIARRLLARDVTGRVLLLYPPGLEFVAALFGCAYAGLVAVPAYPPQLSRLARTLSRLQSIARDADATCVLTTSSVRAASPAVFALAPDLEAMPWIVCDDLEDSDFEPVPGAASSVALLQYTSGSTGDPKGIVITHRNIFHNLGLLRESLGVDRDAVLISWLPVYHDMGLIGKILFSAYCGSHCVFMSPLHFMESPFRWLRALTVYGGSVSAAPNFAYERCVRRVTAEQKATLDLRTWRRAVNAAEPIRADTLERFVAAFSPCGFRREAFVPMYGLAEASLFVSGRWRDRGYVTCSVHGPALAEGKVMTSAGASAKVLVGCGDAVGDQTLAIVDPVSRRRRATDEVGEIWVCSRSASNAYWRKPDETRTGLEARIAGTEEGPFVRTGDLGFMDSSGELFVTGRLNDLLIVRGRNYYPQDVERTVEASHPGMRPGGGAAFTVDVQSEARLVIVQELELPPDAALTERREALEAVRAAVGQEHEVSVYAVALVKRGTIPKTPSGKVMRSACRQMYLDGNLDVLESWRLATSALSDTPPANNPQSANRPQMRTKEEIERWLVCWLSETLGRDLARSIDPGKQFFSYGIDSLAAVMLMERLSDWLGWTVQPETILDHPSPMELAAFLANATTPDLATDQCETVESWT
jgi:acyl-CoA synthetase (AMP-forming)/AMP-acid ligase II/acyl carrier protein